MVSISPVPKLDPGPVSYFHWESMPDPDEPLKSSLKTVDQPDGGPGTAAGTAAVPEVSAAGLTWAVSGGARCVTAASAITAAIMASASPPAGPPGRADGSA